MSKALEIELFVYDSLVFGKVLKQDDNIIERGKFRFVASNELSIKSVDYPDMGIYRDSNMLYTRGSDKEKDNIIIYFDCNSNKRALELANKIKVAVDELNKKYELEDIDEITNSITQII